MRYDTWKNSDLIWGDAWGDFTAERFTGNPYANVMSAARIYLYIMSRRPNAGNAVLAGWYRSGFGKWSKSAEGKEARDRRMKAYALYSDGFAKFFACMGAKDRQ
jgi:hypothetical protein